MVRGELGVDLVEAEPKHVSMFVRDRGAGFDAEEIAADRKGIAESIAEGCSDTAAPPSSGRCPERDGSRASVPRRPGRP